MGPFDIGVKMTYSFLKVKLLYFLGGSMLRKSLFLGSLMVVFTSSNASDGIAKLSERAMNGTSHVIVNDTTVTATGVAATLAFVPVSTLLALHLKFSTQQNNATGLSAHQVFYLKSLCALYAVMQTGLCLTMSSYKKKLFYVKMNMLAYCAGLSALVYGLGFDSKVFAKIPKLGALYSDLGGFIRTAMDKKQNQVIPSIEERIELEKGQLFNSIKCHKEMLLAKWDSVMRALRIR